MADVRTHQTVTLDKGRHRSPDQGACVMELASMLAGEAFCDHPSSVCPVIGAFLRPYNDGLDDERRQDLYGVAAEIVGTGGSRSVRRIRARHCRLRLQELDGHGRRRRLPAPMMTVGAELADAYLRTGRHADALAFVGELVALGRPATFDGAEGAHAVGRGTSVPAH